MTPPGLPGFSRPPGKPGSERKIDVGSQWLPDSHRSGWRYAIDALAGLHAPGATMVVDSDLLKQATLNIVVNAIEAMPQGGELRFESSVEGEEVEIRISDSGAGIPPEKREKIFQLYFTTKKKGSGIGLAMTRPPLSPICHFACMIAATSSGVPARAETANPLSRE